MAELAALAAGGAEAFKAFNIHKQKIAESEAYRDAKNRSMAATTREMAEEQRNKEFMHSRALAIAAASGGGTEGGVVKLLADLNAEGEYRIMSRLWAGVNEAQALIFKAKEAEKEGDAAITAGIINAFTMGTSAYASAGGSFGGGGSSMPSAASVGAGPSGATSAGPK